MKFLLLIVLALLALASGQLYYSPQLVSYYQYLVHHHDPRLVGELMAQPEFSDFFHTIQFHNYQQHRAKQAARPAEAEEDHEEQTADSKPVSRYEGFQNPYLQGLLKSQEEMNKQYAKFYGIKPELAGEEDVEENDIRRSTLSKRSVPSEPYFTPVPTIPPQLVASPHSDQRHFLRGKLGVGLDGNLWLVEQRPLRFDGGFLLPLIFH